MEVIKVKKLPYGISNYEELIEDSLVEVNGDYDVEFNENLFKLLSSNYRKKERISLDVTLKSLNCNFNYNFILEFSLHNYHSH